MLDLAGKVAFVTGAASGIGLATAERLAGLGATVLGADVSDAGGKEAFAALGPPHRYAHLDVTDPQAWHDVVDEAIAGLGRLDVLHLNAGVMTRPPEVPILDDPLDWLEPGHYRSVMAVNVDGVAYGLMAAIPHLSAAGGDVVITSSGAGVGPFEPDPVYSASKHALIGLARSLTPALARRGIRLNVVCPAGGVLTGIIPTDLRELPGKVFAPPSYIADSVVAILESGETGRVWIAQGVDEPAWAIDFQDPVPRQAYVTDPAP